MMGTNRLPGPPGAGGRYPYPSSQPGPRAQNPQNNQAQQHFQPQFNHGGMGMGGHPGGQYYPPPRYQQQQQQYYAPPPPPPRPPMPPKPVTFVPAESREPLVPPGTSSIPDNSVSTASLPPPPPPPPQIPTGAMNEPTVFFPLAPPPLPPLFPYLSPELAHSLEQGATKCGTSFKKDTSELPFIPVIINDDDLKKMTEQVKTRTEEYKGKSMLFYEDIIDQSLPKELKEMFQPLYCKLCKLTLSSPVVARDHYKGKKHKRAGEVWIQNNADKSKIKNGSGNVSCQGANPHGILNGIVTPAGQNNFRQPTPIAPPPPLMGGNRRGPPNQTQQQQRGFNNRAPAPLMGLNNFDRKRTHSSTESPSPKQPEFIPAYRAALASPGPSKKKPKTNGAGPNFDYCNLCAISLTSQAHADQHYNGKNHKQKLLSSRKNGEFGEDPRFGIGTSFSNGQWT